jgi:4-hydroxyphenylpyruvate dioxygenase
LCRTYRGGAIGLKQRYRLGILFRVLLQHAVTIPMQPALSTVCTLASPLENDLAHYAAGQCDAVELWLTKVETYLQKNSADDFLELLAEHKIAAPVAAYQGGLLDSQGDRRAETWRHFRKRLELCSQLGVGLLVVAADVAPPLEQEDLDRVRVSLRQAAEAAQDCGVRLALEPQAGSAICNNLQTALAMVEETASPALGICLDAFHFAVGPSKTEDLALLSCENLAHVTCRWNRSCVGCEKSTTKAVYRLNCSTHRFFRCRLVSLAKSRSPRCEKCWDWRKWQKKSSADGQPLLYRSLFACKHSLAVISPSPLRS